MLKEKLLHFTNKLNEEIVKRESLATELELSKNEIIKLKKKLMKLIIIWKVL